MNHQDENNNTGETSSIIPSSDELTQAIAEAISASKVPAPSTKIICDAIKRSHPDWKLLERRVKKFANRTIKDNNKATAMASSLKNLTKDSSSEEALHTQDLSDPNSSTDEGHTGIGTNSNTINNSTTEHDDLEMITPSNPAVEKDPSPTKQKENEYKPKNTEIAADTSSSASKQADNSKGHLDDNTGSKEDDCCAQGCSIQ